MCYLILAAEGAALPPYQVHCPNLPAPALVVPGQDEQQEIEKQDDSVKNCNICDYTYKTKIGLKIHIGRRHKDIQQLDGNNLFCERKTDFYWEGWNIDAVKTYQNYLDVLADIDESPLEKQEKEAECSKVTQIRKKALGASLIRRFLEKPLVIWEKIFESIQDTLRYLKIFLDNFEVLIFSELIFVVVVVLYFFCEL